MAPAKSALRRLRFFLLEKLLLPVAIVPLLLWMRSWRTRAPSPDVIRAGMDVPRLVLVTYHGMLLHLLAFASIPLAHRRQVVVMLSPSLDGRLLAALLGHFGIGQVQATSGSGGVRGSVEFIRRIQAGDIGLVAADGPRGPCCIAKPGIVRLAAAAGAHLGLVTTSASRGLQFGSWDRAHLPLPFARVELSGALLPPPGDGDQVRMLEAVQTTMVQAARELHSPILPPRLQVKAGH